MRAYLSHHNLFRGGMRKIATLILMTTWVCSAIAEPHSIRGWGATNCVEYLKQYQDNPEAVDELVLSWMWGFMSGFQFLAEKPYDLSQVNSEAAKVFVRNYCLEHPTSSYYEGILQFMGTIPQFTLPRTRRLP